MGEFLRDSPTRLPRSAHWVHAELRGVAGPQRRGAVRAAELAVAWVVALELVVNPRNPLDLTPMATEAAYEAASRVLLASGEFDGDHRIMVQTAVDVRIFPFRVVIHRPGLQLACVNI